MRFVRFGWLRRWPSFLIVCAAVVGVGRATTVIPPEFSALVNGSDYIVHAVVKSVTSEKRAGPKGAKIVTLVELDVIEVVAGTPPEKVTLQLLGGKVGEEELRVVGMPVFEVGDEDVLFVSRNGRSVCPLYAMMHGRYAIEEEPGNRRKYVARVDGRPLRNVSEVQLPIAEGRSGEFVRRAASLSEGLTPADFIREIRANVRPGSALQRLN